MSAPEELWTYLQATDKHIIMYGMGNGADKILAVCDKLGIEVEDFFASDGFVRGHSFHGKRVLSYSEIKEKYGADNIIVLLSFASSLPSVLATIHSVADECELYAPDVPVCGNTLFTIDFAKSHRTELEKVYTLLADEQSKRIFENTVYFKISGNIRYLDNAISQRDEIFNSLLHAENIKSYADLGAYNGDTIRELARYALNLSEVYAFEPDRRSFRKLLEYVEGISTPHIHAVNAAAWCGEDTLLFGDEGNRNSGLFASGKTVEIPATSLDRVLGGAVVDYIKYDVEGCEREALFGSEETILTYRPRLCVSVYHRSEDIFALPLQIHTMRPDYKLYLRREPYIPAWDLNLICV